MHYLKKELYQLIQQDSKIFDFIQESSLDGIWYWDLQQPENEWMSAKFWQTLGYDPETKPHKAAAWQSMIFEEDLAIAVHNFHQHCQDPQYPYDQTVRYQHAQGHTVWIRCRGLAIRDHTGKAIRMLGAHQDVTALKQKEELLERCNQAANIGFWEMDLVSGHVFISPVLKKMLDVKSTLLEKEDFFYFFEGGSNLFTLLETADIKENLIHEVKLNKKNAGEAQWVKLIIAKDQANKEIIYGTCQDISQVRGYQQKLIDQEKKYRSVFNSSFGAIGILTTSGLLLEANETALSLGDLHEWQVIGKYFWDTPWWSISKEVQNKLKASILTAAKGGEVSYESLIRVQEKNTTTILLSLRPIYNDNNDIIFLLAEGLPIQETLDLNTRYHSLIEGTQLGVWEWDIKSDTFSVNQHWASILGLQEAHLAHLDTETWQAFIHPGDLKTILPKMQACISGQQDNCECEFRVQHKNGHWVWIAEKAYIAQYDLQGNPLVIYGIRQNINARKQAQEQLRQSEEAFHNNFKYAGVGMAIVSPQGQWLEVNAKLCEIVGYTQEELLALTFQDITYPYDLDADLHFLNQVIDGELENYQLEKRYVHKQGHLVYILLVVSVVRDIQGKVLYFVSQIIDVSELKKAQAQVQTLLDLAHQENHQLVQIRQQLEKENIDLKLDVETDELTKAYNRRAFNKRLRQEIDAMQQQEMESLSLVILDIDHFKQYNDTYGHPAGDIALRKVAETLEKTKRSCDFFARYGGEEFVLILAETSAPAAIASAQRLREAVSHIKGLRRPVTISLGVGTWQTQMQAQDLLQAADQALYQAKAQGRNCVVHYQDIL
ncbi:PAS domain S-box-containing protein/diguanylate cyclase (GGDEF) domain-containing protein [Allopseudospirillum japonicum]|uniref:PAS domain S-box-containing protein/diguanylate cyclase (GGDEF) domain-containing protein n=1 Tax=Allopseudospirillum japonicum TaxID=64971 RepID=A0A1H6RB93_9GAMM|nr:PAS domain S-box protein [Allopseudospirillum japonicum]SEI51746.1 PAS domain S-box-containing protein/diguanylate cyclase (GGDEF) domain-containing protein [Allopseudospirillum japonicum]